MAPIEVILIVVNIIGMGYFIYLMYDMWTMTPGENMDLQAPTIKEEVSEEFEEKATRMFKEVKSKHPKLCDREVTFNVKRELDHPAYGRHVAVGLKNHKMHRIDIAEKPHSSDKKLYDTITHELAHMLDVMDRGYSDHTGAFEEKQNEIEMYAPMVEVM